MGMFDRVFGVPLPDGFQPDDGELQTKDFDCTLSRLELRDGRLFDGTRDLNYHGVIRLIGTKDLPPVRDDSPDRFFPKASPRTYDFREYIAKFTDGNLVSVQRVKEKSE